MNTFWATWTPRALSVLRLIVGFLFIWNVTRNFFGFPASGKPAGDGMVDAHPDKVTTASIAKVTNRCMGAATRQSDMAFSAGTVGLRGGIDLLSPPSRPAPGPHPETTGVGP